MKYTVRYAHLHDKPILEIGNTVHQDDYIGTMGNTGRSDGAHLHIDCVEGEQAYRYRLSDIEHGDPKPAPRQLNFFIYPDLFGIKPEITTYYADSDYQIKYRKLHLGYDVVPVDRHATTRHHDIHWNRSMPGRVLLILDDPEGYGHCLYVTFEV